MKIIKDLMECGFKLKKPSGTSATEHLKCHWSFNHRWKTNWCMRTKYYLKQSSSLIRWVLLFIDRHNISEGQELCNWLLVLIFLSHYYKFSRPWLMPALSYQNQTQTRTHKSVILIIPIVEMLVTKLWSHDHVNNIIWVTW